MSAGKRTDGTPLKPGTAVYKFNASEGYHHVGLYIGEGVVIEAKGTAYGVVKSKIGSGWTHWGELKGVDYAEKGEQIAMSKTKLAVVTTASGSLNMHKSYAAKGRNHLSASYEQDILALPETPPEGRRSK